MSTSYNSNTCMQLTAHVSTCITVQHSNLQHKYSTCTACRVAAVVVCAVSCCRALQNGHNGNPHLGQPAVAHHSSASSPLSASSSSSPSFSVFVLSPACSLSPMSLSLSSRCRLLGRKPPNPIHHLVFSFPCSGTELQPSFRFLDIRESRTPPVHTSCPIPWSLPSLLFFAFCSLPHCRLAAFKNSYSFYSTYSIPNKKRMAYHCASTPR